MDKKLNKAYNNTWDKIIVLINSTKVNLTSYVNTKLVLLYWNIGRTIRIDILNLEKAEYGQRIFDNLSEDLILEYGRGYSKANLRRMVLFYDFFPDEKISATLSHQLTWSHIVELIKIKDDLKREFYLQMCVNEMWSVRIFKDRINSMLFERTAISRKPEETIKKDLELLKTENKITTNLFFRDPYVLDFLDLKGAYTEKDLESAILAELEKFILEFGTDFAFLARQKRIIVDNTDYYIDLLFFHRKMKRLVVIELKLGEFKPSDKGQIELYLRWLEKYEMNDGEETPIGIILCSDKNQESVELLQLDKSGIHVGQYLTQLPPKELFRKKLYDALNSVKNYFIND